ncbi:MAG TPA: hypothetical protein PLF81_29950 [Candidatus Anammoximicrobium sp.]|nr:hypothetical protein [Candidatus Anammoximicrobium sp.]
MNAQRNLAAAAIAVLVTGLAAGTQTQAASPSPGTVPGRVTNLGQLKRPEAADKAMLAHYQLFQQSQAEAIDALQHGDLKQFVVAYREIARSVTEISDIVAGGHESLGEADASLELLAAELKAFQARGGGDGEGRKQLLEDLKAFRDTLATQLDALRQRYQAAVPQDEDQRMKLRKQMAVLVSRIEHFQKLQDSMDGSGAALTDAAAATTQAKLQEMREALEREQAALRLTASAMRLRVDEAVEEMGRSFGLIEMQARLPQDQLRRLADLQQKSEQVLRDLLREHQRATEGFLAILVSDEQVPVPDEAELMARVAKALGEAAPAAAENDEP